MRIPLVSFILIFSLLAAQWSFADLGDFKKGVEQEEQKKKEDADQPPEKKTEDNKKKNSESSDSDKASGEIFGAIMQVVFGLWFYHNLSCTYNDYPYAQGSGFLKYNLKEPFKGKFFHLEVESEYFHAGEMGNGLHLALGGKLLPFLGPEIETTRLWDGSNMLEITLLGGNLSLFQSDFLSCDVYVQSASLHGVLDRYGLAAGFSFQSYPFWPMSLSARLGSQDYNGILFHEGSIQLGVVMDRYEIYGGWRSLQSLYTGLQGPYAGLKVHF